MLYNGVDIKTVQEILGHEEIQTTLDIYTHVLDEQRGTGREQFIMQYRFVKD